jgi:hypothetical protein
MHVKVFIFSHLYENNKNHQNFHLPHAMLDHCWDSKPFLQWPSFGWMHSRYNVVEGITISNALKS